MCVEGLPVDMLFNFDDLLQRPESPPLEGSVVSGKEYAVCTTFERFPCETSLDVMRALMFVMQQFAVSSFNAHVIGFCARHILTETPEPHEGGIEIAAKRHNLIAKNYLPMSVPHASSTSDDQEIAEIIATIKEEKGESVESFLELLFCSFEKGIVESPAINWAIIHILRGLPLTISPVPHLCNTPLPKPGWDDDDQWASRVAELLYISASLPFDQERHACFIPYIPVLEGLNDERDAFLEKLKEIVPKEGGPSGPKRKIDSKALEKLIAYRSGDILIENYRETLAELRELTAQVLATVGDLRFVFAVTLPLPREQVPIWQGAFDTVLSGAGKKIERLNNLKALNTTPATQDPDIAANHKEFLEDKRRARQNAAALVKRLLLRPQTRRLSRDFVDIPLAKLFLVDEPHAEGDDPGREKDEGIERFAEK